MVKIYKIKRFLRKAFNLSSKIFTVIATLIIAFFVINNFIYGFCIWGSAQRAYEKKDYGRALVLYNYASGYYNWAHFARADRERHVEAQYKLAQTYLVLGQKINAENAIKEGMFEMMDQYGFYSPEYAQYVRDYVVEYYISKGEYARAREYLILTEYAYSKLNTDGRELAAIDRLYGDIYAHVGDEVASLNYYQNAYRLAKKYKSLDTPTVIPIYQRIADFYIANGDLEQGTVVYTELFGLLNMKILPEKIAAAKANLEIADAYYTKEDYVTAIKYYEGAYAIIQTLPYGNEMKAKINDLRLKMAGVYNKNGKYAQEREMMLEIERTKRFWFKPITL